MVLDKLEPAALWQHFEEINAIPRASKKEERIIDFMMSFGKSLGLETIKDDVGNVIIKKPAQGVSSQAPTIVMQSHLDMVHQKNADTVFDFDTQGIDMLIDGDWVKANGTTLGADNGIGVATIMAILSSKEITHPHIEALFTIDEETGMTGALGLKGGLLSGSVLLNLDTEDDHELTIGCAGGIDVTCQGKYIQSEVQNNFQALAVQVKGLTGGHSGMDIHLGRGNANKIMNRLLFELNARLDIKIATIDGGGLRNAIPRESKAIFLVDSNAVNKCSKIIKKLTDIIIKEFSSTDSELAISVTEAKTQASVMEVEFQDKLLSALYACDNGIYRMSPDVEGLVQTSNNLARVLVNKGKFEILCLTRSSVETEKADQVNSLKAAFDRLGGVIKTSGSYPGWQPKPQAHIVQLMSEIYQQMFDKPADVNACHAGLECGIIGKNYPNMDMISFGPNIRGAHSPDEKVQISSVQKYWSFLLETLNRLSNK